MITGAEYYRRLNHMMRKELEVLSGVNKMALKKILDGDNVERISYCYFAQIAEVFGVTVDDLLVEHDERELNGTSYIPDPDRPPTNCVEVYRRRKSLRLIALGERLGISKQAVSKLCHMSNPSSKHIQSLAAYEGITPKEFIQYYSPGAVA